MLATLSSRRVFDERWVFERKLDGVRALAVREEGGATRLLSRTGRAIGATYPEVVEALSAQGGPGLVVDGEIVAMNHGRTDFSLLQQRLGLTNPAAVGPARSPSPTTSSTSWRWTAGTSPPAAADTQGAAARRARLRRAAAVHPAPQHDSARGAADLLAEACARGWEGLIAKRADAPYQHRRSGDWLKLKCERGQEFVVGGFTEPAGARVGFGALLVGYYDEAGALRYAGKVGTGFSSGTLRDLRAELDAAGAHRSPFADAAARARRALGRAAARRAGRVQRVDPRRPAPPPPLPRPARRQGPGRRGA